MDEREEKKRSRDLGISPWRVSLCLLPRWCDIWPLVWKWRHGLAHGDGGDSEAPVGQSQGWLEPLTDIGTACEPRHPVTVRRELGMFPQFSVVEAVHPLLTPVVSLLTQCSGVCLSISTAKLWVGPLGAETRSQLLHEWRNSILSLLLGDYYTSRLVWLVRVTLASIRLALYSRNSTT